jgi:hypothetical protein
MKRGRWSVPECASGEPRWSVPDYQYQREMESRASMEQWSVPAAVCERVREDRERGVIARGEIAREERSPVEKSRERSWELGFGSGEIARVERSRR